MSREIKGRSWDGNRMIYWDTLEIDFMGKSPIIRFKNDTLDGKVKLTKHRDMLFTGLTDKNGTPIYEGDIVLLEDEIARGDGQFDDEIGEVAWDENEACFMFKGYYTSEYLGHAYPDQVIGNKFENPELLEQ